MEGLAEIPYEQLMEDYVWVGTPDDIAERIDETLQLSDMQEIGITVNAGNAPHWMAIKNQELFASEVAPRFGSNIASAAAIA